MTCYRINHKISNRSKYTLNTYHCFRKTKTEEENNIVELQSILQLILQTISQLTYFYGVISIQKNKSVTCV